MGSYTLRISVRKSAGARSSSPSTLAHCSSIFFSTSAQTSSTVLALLISRWKQSSSMPPLVTLSITPNASLRQSSFTDFQTRLCPYEICSRIAPITGDSPHSWHTSSTTPSTQVAPYNNFCIINKSFKAPSAQQTKFALIAFLICELGNFSIHILLKNLRPPGTRDRKIPMVTLNPLPRCHQNILA